MDEDLSGARELYQRALAYDRWPPKDLEDKLTLMTVTIDCLERAWKKATLSFPAVDVLSFIKDIEYALERIHRERAYYIREWLRIPGKKYWNDFETLIDSVYMSGEPMGHFCFKKEELKKWNSLPFDPSGMGLLSNKQKLRRRWKVFKKRFAIRQRG